jgi:hypothetical protein
MYPRDPDPPRELDAGANVPLPIDPLEVGLDRIDSHEQFLYWPQRIGGGRYTQGPDQREHLWILELDGARLVVDASSFPKTSPAARAELWDVAKSVQVTSR